MFVDAAHLYASAGRSLGLGAAGVRGSLDPDVLLREVVALVPAASRPPTLYWYDGRGSSVSPPTPGLRHGMQMRVLALRGGRQRLLEAALLRDVLFELAEPPAEKCFYLLGDPRRHSLALESASAAGHDLVLVGVAHGETAPADRQWLRRPELQRALTGVPPRSRGLQRPIYRRPSVQTVTG